MRDKLAKEKRGSKFWWKITNEIVQKQVQTSQIPALKVGNEWLHDSRSKANALAQHFSSKFVLPLAEANKFSASFEDRSFDRWVLVRCRGVASTLAKLDVDSGTGPDLAARVLKYCGRKLSRPIAKLIRRIIDQGFWPTA